MKTKINRIIRAKLKTYIRQNWEAPFIIGFMLLIAVAAVFLAIRSALPAEVLAIIAYFSLAVGVIVRFTRLLTKDKEQDKKNHGSD